MRLVVASGIAVLAILVAIWAMQRKLIYFPSSYVPDLHTVGLTGALPVSFPTSDGLTLGGWFVSRVATPEFAVIIFNGNAGNRSHRAAFADALARSGLAVLVFDYRGFGGNGGSPTEGGLRLDARAAREALLAHVDIRSTGVVYFGESLGTAVAVELASEHPPAALVLRSPFTSMTDVGRHHYPWLPVGWLLRDRFDTLRRIPGVHTPTFVIAGDEDQIVPISQSRRVFEAANEPKSLLVIPHAEHNDEVLITGRTMIEAVLRFLRNLR